VTDQHFVRRAHFAEGHKVTIPVTTVRYIGGEYIPASSDPHDPAQQSAQATALTVVSG